MSEYLGFEPVDPEITPDYYFVSYNNGDHQRVGAIAKKLMDAGVPLWYDYGIEYGADWEETIAERIDKCKGVLLFYTDGILRKKDSFVKIEYNLAEGSRKDIKVVELDGLNSQNAPYRHRVWIEKVKKKQCIAATGLNDDATAREILRAIGKSETSRQPQRTNIPSKPAQPVTAHKTPRPAQTNKTAATPPKSPVKTGTTAQKPRPAKRKMSRWKKMRILRNSLLFGGIALLLLGALDVLLSEGAVLKAIWGFLQQFTPYGWEAATEKSFLLSLHVSSVLAAISTVLFYCKADEEATEWWSVLIITVGYGLITWFSLAGISHWIVRIPGWNLWISIGLLTLAAAVIAVLLFFTVSLAGDLLEGIPALSLSVLFIVLAILIFRAWNDGGVLHSILSFFRPVTPYATEKISDPHFLFALNVSSVCAAVLTCAWIFFVTMLEDGMHLFPKILAGLTGPATWYALGGLCHLIALIPVWYHFLAILAVVLGAALITAAVFFGLVILDVNLNSNTKRKG